MFELFRKSVLAGVGLAVVTKDMIQEATRRLVKEGKISTDEAGKLADELVKSGEREVDEINSRISETMKKWTDSMELVRKKELQELNARLDALEQKILLLELGIKKEPIE